MIHISYILATIDDKKQYKKRRSIVPQGGDTTSYSSSAIQSIVTDDRKLAKHMILVCFKQKLIFCILFRQR